MNIPRLAILPTSKLGSPPAILDHGLAPTGSRQRRLVDRLAMVPLVDLTAYRFRAVIDWIEFRVSFSRRTQAQHVQRILRRYLGRDSHITPDTLLAGKTFTSCSIRVQEPASLATIASIHEDLTRTFGEAAQSRVSAIEVSVDAYPRKPSDTARTSLLGALQRTLWTGRDIFSKPNSRPRTFGAERQLEKLIPPPHEEAVKKQIRYDGELMTALVPEHHRAPFIDGTMYFGAREDDDVMVRIMDKVKDKQRPDGTFDALRPESKRVRVEVTLKGTELLALGIFDVPSLRRMKITSIKKRYFQFKLPTFSYRTPVRSAGDVMQNAKQAWRARTYLRSGILGLTAMDAASEAFKKAQYSAVRKTIGSITPGLPIRRPGKRIQPSFISWQELNRKIDAAFRHLDKREKTAWGRRGNFHHST